MVLAPVAVVLANVDHISAEPCRPLNARNTVLKHYILLFLSPSPLIFPAFGDGGCGGHVMHG